jgi:crotonobetainyl-CoA:carnitine CoA-transferase CaiB-like acyl-CoA transferase
VLLVFCDTVFYKPAKNYEILNMEILKGLKVIELASVLAGPSVGQFLAECGAEVLKIENFSTAGDVTRSWKSAAEDPKTGISAYFSCANWGKKSLCLDLPNDVEQLYTLLRKADIVLASYKPGDAEKLQTDYESLKKINSKIIYGHITGYGNDSERVGYDAIIQAEAGFTYINGEKGGNSLKMPVALVDLLAAHQLKEGILLALLRREKTGEGAYVHTSLFEAAVSSLANQACNYLCADFVPQRMGSEHPNIAPYGTIFDTSDGAIVFAVGNDKQFAALCEVLKIPNTAKDARFCTNFSRVSNRIELFDILKNETAKFQKDFLMNECQKKQVPAGLVNDMKAVFEQEKARNCVFSFENFKGLRQISFEISHEKKAELTPPPHLNNFKEN